MASVETIMLVNPDRERLALLQRIGHDLVGWSDVDHTRLQGMVLPTLKLVVPHVDNFARN